MTNFELSRAVRFCLPIGPAASPVMKQPRSNTFAGWPSMVDLGIYVELVVTCRREPDAESGFVMSIAEIDDAVRTHALPLVAQALAGGGADPARLLARIAGSLQPALDGAVTELTWHLTPHYHLGMDLSDMSRVHLSQQFEFAASHRLHNPDLDEQTNRRLYGKCNNPSGHGHNYRLQVVASRPLDGGRSPAFSLQDLERIVDERVIERFDHTHLNVDAPEFADLVPTVEHIAKVCFELAEGAVAAAGGRLEAMTVWETDKTSCTYRGERDVP